MLVDDLEQLWVGTSRYGIMILDKHHKIIKRLTDSIPGLTSLPSNWINSIESDKDGNKWVSTLRGVTMIEKDSYRIHDLSKHPILEKVSRVPSGNIWFDSKHRLWVGSTRGAFCYDATSGTLQQFTEADGLPDNNILCVNEDKLGNTYIGTAAGLSIIRADSSIISYNRSNGLRNDRCEDILVDEKGYLWIGNLSSILRFDPRNQTFAAFEDGHGFSHAGFRLRSSHKKSRR